MEGQRVLIKPWVVYPVVVVLVVIIVVIGYFCFYQPVTTVLLLRHAERSTTPPDNPSLSAAGQARAQTLVHVAGGAGVGAIYTTETCRTAQTGQPLGNHLGLTINVQQNTIPGDQLADCDPPITVPVNRLAPTIDTPAELANHVLAALRGQVVLVVGHSDTIHLIVEALGAGPIAPVGDVYDNLFIVTVYKLRRAKVVNLKYGNPGCMHSCP